MRIRSRRLATWRQKKAVEVGSCKRGRDVMKLREGKKRKSRPEQVGTVRGQERAAQQAKYHASRRRRSVEHYFVSSTSSRKCLIHQAAPSELLVPTARLLLPQARGLDWCASPGQAHRRTSPKQNQQRHSSAPNQHSKSLKSSQIRPGSMGRAGEYFERDPRNDGADDSKGSWPLGQPAQMAASTSVQYATCKSRSSVWSPSAAGRESWRVWTDISSDECLVGLV
ncbi:hypothetical protein BD289DRAFT_148030 [Coniella lustricola]|uniref:Uncharacterized protein n=1 Tax=Coniella lustricola TaxID=2025994 RepID=A0A2T2ZUX0_9PEZI|nr:hypothetical protein BD289DRAFT_148030 [Coniella lustricola]